MTAYYNEIDPKAAAWLRELIKQGHIAPGEVDERSILDVTPNDLRGFTQYHFFAGIGVWSYALRQAGWPDDRPVWTGSCPCQPFSAAGKGKGFDDERHLWPYFHHLIKVCRPAIIFGEQVAHKAGATWFDLVQADLAGEDYASGMVVFPACGVGAPHQRQRLYWVANSIESGFAWQSGRSGAQELGVTQRGLSDQLGDTICDPSQRNTGRLHQAQGEGDCQRREDGGIANGRSDASADGALGNARSGRRSSRNERSQAEGRESSSGDAGHRPRKARSVDIPNGQRLEGREESHSQAPQPELETQRGQDVGGLRDSDGPMPTNGYWRDVDWLGCRDGKWRPVEPSTFPLVDGAPERVGLLRGYGNAIVAPQAQVFVEAFLECESGLVAA